MTVNHDVVGSSPTLAAKISFLTGQESVMETISQVPGISRHLYFRESKLKFGITGTRKGFTPKQKATFKKLLYTEGVFDLEFHHGDCVGVDAESALLVHNFAPEAAIICHPPLYATYRANTCINTVVNEPLDYMVRNRNIVNSVEKMFVVPENYMEVARSGTWATYRYAINHCVPCIIIFPNGRVEYSA